MITTEQIDNAIDWLFKTNASLTREEAGIVAYLREYEERGEFDGSRGSAIDCLARAGYLIEVV